MRRIIGCSICAGEFHRRGVSREGVRAFGDESLRVGDVVWLELGRALFFEEGKEGFGECEFGHVGGGERVGERVRVVMAVDCGGFEVIGCYRKL